MPSPWDPYGALGVARDATREEIRRAFRKAALELHPDRNPDPGAAERFIAVRAAYAALIDTACRAMLDRELDAARAAQRNATQPGKPPPTRGKSLEVMSDEESERLSSLSRSARTAEAEWLAQDLLETYPKDVRLHLVLGELASRRRDWAEASRRYVICVQFHPRNPAYLELYENAERKMESYESPPNFAAIGVAVLSFLLALGVLAMGILNMQRIGFDTLTSSVVAIFTLAICGLSSGIALRRIRLAPIYPRGGPEAWFGTGLAASFLSAALGLLIYWIWVQRSVSSYGGFERLLIASILVAALVALFQPANLTAAPITFLLGSGAFLAGAYAASAE